MYFRALARGLSVSATPSENSVHFYQRQGLIVVGYHFTVAV